MGDAMQHDTQFSVRYVTDKPVPIKDIIDSLRGVDTILHEMALILPKMIDGLEVSGIDIKVREVAQESPLRELFLVALFVSFQKQLEEEVPSLLTDATGILISDRFDTVVTVLTLIVVFYGAGALKDLVFGKGPAGAAQMQLNGLITELSHHIGKSEQTIRNLLDARYADKTMWKRLANATSRFFLPSKRQNSAPIEINGREYDSETVSDVPADYIVDHEADINPSRNFGNVRLELHAQDRDHAGKGWAAVAEGISEKRIRLKLMENVSQQEVWGHDEITGDITVIYDRIGVELVPKEIHLHNVTRFS
jgi:hypothetical protein